MLTVLLMLSMVLVLQALTERKKIHYANDRVSGCHLSKTHLPAAIDYGYK